MVESVLSSPIFTEMILPFLLVFAIVFAVLQKTEIFGAGKKQVDAIIAFVAGLLVVSFGYAVHIITNMIPFLAVGLVVILTFLMLWGMFYKERSFELSSRVKMIAGIVVLIAVVIATLYFTGAWDNIAGVFSGESSSAWISNIIFIVIIVAAVIAVLYGAGGKSESEGK